MLYLYRVLLVKFHYIKFFMEYQSWYRETISNREDKKYPKVAPIQAFNSDIQRESFNKTV
jgi:hypothetical protein